jgi:hypothetical protein
MYRPRPRPPGGHNKIPESAVVRKHLGHLSDPAELPRSWGLAVRELLLAARPKFTGIYVGNGLRFAKIRLSRLKQHGKKGSLEGANMLHTAKLGLVHGRV